MAVSDNLARAGIVSLAARDDKVIVTQVPQRKLVAWFRCMMVKDDNYFETSPAGGKNKDRRMTDYALVRISKVLGRQLM